MSEIKQCVACQRNHDEVPLLMIAFKDERFYICPADLPVLIHQPEKLAGVLPGAENLQAGEHQH